MAALYDVMDGVGDPNRKLTGAFKGIEKTRGNSTWGLERKQKKKKKGKKKRADGGSTAGKSPKISQR